jgi:hypothetical protein
MLLMLLGKPSTACKVAAIVLLIYTFAVAHWLTTWYPTDDEPTVEEDTGPPSLRTLDQWRVALRGGSHAQKMIQWATAKGDDNTDDLVSYANDQVRGRMVALAQEIASNWTKSSIDDAYIMRLGVMCDYLVSCITGDLYRRVQLHGVDGLYTKIVELLSLFPSDKVTSMSLPYPPAYTRKYFTSAAAAHLIYIASYGDATNHQGFIDAQAVPALANLFQHSNAQPIQAMWSAAALQNLAASYCETSDEDGFCYWAWNRTNNTDILQLTADSPLMSDGALARQQIRCNDALIQALQNWTCRGPVARIKTSKTPRPGHNAMSLHGGLRHEECPSIVPWAAAGVLKTLALDISVSDGRRSAQSILNETAVCLCRLVYSPDYLEYSQSYGVWERVRADGAVPCRKLRHPQGGKNGKKRVCVDHEFSDAQDSTCADYDSTTSEADCKAPNSQGVKPSTACCGCGGGRWDNA